MKTGLYSLCISFVLLSAGCGRTEYPPNNREIAEWVLSHGGAVTLVGVKQEIRSVDLLPGQSFGISEINLAETELAIKDFQKLSEVRQLNRLSLYGTEITDEEIDHILGIESLRELELSSTMITDAALEKLKRIETLKKLYVHNTLVTSEGVRTFQQSLSHCKVFASTIN